MVSAAELSILRQKLETVSWTLAIFFNFLFVGLWWGLAIPIPAWMVGAIVAISLAIQYFVVAPELSKIVDHMALPRQEDAAKPKK